jgi:hypothetical protein
VIEVAMLSFETKGKEEKGKGWKTMPVFHCTFLLAKFFESSMYVTFYLYVNKVRG